MDGDDRARLRVFLGQLGDELRRTRAESDLVVLDAAPPVPAKPDLVLRPYIEPGTAERRTLRRRSAATTTTTTMADRFEQLRQRLDQLADTKAIEAIEERMRAVNDPFLMQIACERRRLQLAAGACHAALAQLQKADLRHDHRPAQ